MNTGVSITTSWDDGHPLDLRIAEMLSRFGLAGTFYIPRSAQTPTMTESSVRELAGAFEIGAHTLNHIYLTSTDDATARNEIESSKSWVENITGIPCPLFCPPGGKFGARHLHHIREAGFSAIRTVELLSLDAPRQHPGGLKILPTSVQSHPHTSSAYLKNLVRRRSIANFRLYLTTAHSGDWVRTTEALLQTALRRGGVVHLWGHSWEIDKFDQWKPLEDALRLLGQVAAGDPSIARTNGALLSAPARSSPPLPPSSPATSPARPTPSPM